MSASLTETRMREMVREEIAAGGKRQSEIFQRWGEALEQWDAPCEAAANRLPPDEREAQNG